MSIRKRTLLAVVLAATLAASACSADTGTRSSRPADPASSGTNGGSAGSVQPAPNPLAGMTLYSNPASKPAMALAELHNAGHHDQANLLEPLASQPMATWLPAGPDDAAIVGKIVSDAAAAGEIPVFAIYNLPQRDAGEGHSAGGAADSAAYQTWIESVAGAIGDRPAIIVLEPDGVTAVADHHLEGEAAAERLRTLRRAIETLTALPNAHVYLDAGNAGWKSPPDMVWPLHEAGVDLADGIAVNVANYYRDDQSETYGREILSLLGNPGGMVIDSSRNGNGAWDGPDAWCNPPDRKIGQPPGVGRPDSVVHAWLWVKVPGESDGTCRDGASAGTFEIGEAMQLVMG